MKKYYSTANKVREQLNISIQCRLKTFDFATHMIDLLAQLSYESASEDNIIHYTHVADRNFI